MAASALCGYKWRQTLPVPANPREAALGAAARRTCALMPLRRAWRWQRHVVGKCWCFCVLQVEAPALPACMGPTCHAPVHTVAIAGRMKRIPLLLLHNMLCVHELSLLKSGTAASNFTSAAKHKTREEKKLHSVVGACTTNHLPAADNRQPLACRMYYMHYHKRKQGKLRLGQTSLA